MRTARRQHSYLRRLDPEYYRGISYAHWSMTVQDRKTCWLDPVVHHRLREILTHTMFRYALCCPIYCCMPDHMHLIWIGLSEDSDQRNAAKFFRSRFNSVLEEKGARFQAQPYDHVLRDHERNRSALETVVEYIARNPERAGLVPADRYADYAYTGCLVPGYPELVPWQADFWNRFWKVFVFLTENGLTRGVDEKERKA